MSEINNDHQYYLHHNNYSNLEIDIYNENKVLLDSLIGIFGGIIIIYLLVLIYYFRESIKTLCNRPLRRQKFMIQLGELKHNMDDENEIENEEQATNNNGSKVNMFKIDI